METLAQDIRYALRSLARAPGFAAVVVLTLALGFGANAALFSVVDAVLLRRLPFAEPGELAQVWECHERGSATNVVSPANFADWRREARGFADLAGYWRQPLSLTGLGEPEEVQVTIASPGIFRLLGLAPAAGRLLADDDVAAGRFTGDAAVLSHDYWQRRFGGDPGAVGSSVTLGTSSVTIVGVAPPAARLVEPAADLWLPTSFEWANRVDMGRFISVVGRRAPGVSPEQAQAEMDAVARRLAQAHPEFNTGWGVNLVPLSEQLVGDVRPALLLLLGAAGLLLLIACANVANLMLVRTAGREREIAIRAALGAGSARIFRQLLTESALLVAAAAVAGQALAALGSGGLLALLPADLRIPQLEGVRLDASAVLFTGLLALLAGLVFGLVPVAGTRTPRLMDGLREGRSETGDGRQRGLRGGLVVAEVALALVLAAGAGLLFRSFLELRRVDTGLELDSVLTARLTLPRGRYGEPQARAAFFRQARERVAALPGVESASAIQWLPLSGMRSATTFFVDDKPRPELGAEPVTDVRVVLPGYFETLGIPLLAGRAIDERDHAEAPAVAVVNETLARRYWPGEDPVGRRLSYNWGDWVSVEVIGVVADVRFRGVDQAVDPEVFRPHAQDPNSFMNLVVRTAAEPAALVADVTRAIRDLDPLLPVANVRTLEDYYAATFAEPRLNLWLFGAFSLLALTLAAIGVYGVISYTVAQRTREIGIRMALGAERRSVAALVVRHGLGLAALGAAVGLGGALALARLMESLLFGVGTADPLTFAAAPLVLLAVAAGASLVPARRASRVDPTVVLRDSVAVPRS